MKRGWKRQEVAAATRRQMGLGEGELHHGSLGAHCAYCGIPFRSRRLFGWTHRSKTTDHVIPLSRGGSNRSGNRVPCCRACNKAKGAMTPEEFREACDFGEFWYERHGVELEGDWQ